MTKQQFRFRPFNVAREEQAIRNLRSCPMPQGPRYVPKQVNGIWTIFDRVAFRNCEDDLGSEANAIALINS